MRTGNPRPWAASLTRLENELKGWDSFGSSMSMSMSDPVLQYGGGFLPDLMGQVQVTGLQELMLAFERVDEKVRFACDVVLATEAKRIYDESQREVPVDSGDLKREGYWHRGTKIAAVASMGEATSGAGDEGPGLATFDYSGSIGGGWRTENLSIPEYSIGYDVSLAGRPYGVYVHEIPPPAADWKPQVKHSAGDRRSYGKASGRYRGLEHPQRMQYARHESPTKWHFLSDPFERSADRFPKEMVAAVVAAIASVRFVPGTMYPSAKRTGALSSGTGPARLRKR